MTRQQCIEHALASITTAKGRILIKEWLPGPIPNSVRHALRDVERDEGEGAPETDPQWGEPGLTAAEEATALTAGVYWDLGEDPPPRSGQPRG